MAIRALFNHKQVNGIYTGPGWDNWVSTISVQTNLDTILKGKECHLVIGYKPLEISGFADITYNKCIRYNEMYDKEWTLKEITESKANVIICHHYNDYKEYINILKTIWQKEIDKCLTWVPHSAEASIFKPKPEIEPIDFTPTLHSDETLLPFTHDTANFRFENPGVVSIPKDKLPKEAFVTERQLNIKNISSEKVKSKLKSNRDIPDGTVVEVRPTIAPADALNTRQGKQVLVTVHPDP